MKSSSTSERLKQLMKSQNLRQVDVLNMAKPFCDEHNVKLGKTDLSQYLSGKVEPGQDKLAILGHTFGVSEAWLLGYDVPMQFSDFQSSVERVKALCKERKIPISRLERDLGFANGYISQLRKGVFPSDRLAKIADYLSVSIDYLLTGEQKEKASVSTSYPGEEANGSFNRAAEVVFYDEYIRLCNSISKSPTAVAKEMGFAGAHVTKWKKGSTPTDATIFKVCDYFNLPHNHFSSEGDEETKMAVIQSDNGPIYLENTYLRLAQGAKELGLDDDDISAILDFFRKLKL